MQHEQLVETYIKLRDTKAQLKAARDAEIKKIDDVMDKIEAALLQSFNTLGVESVRTTAGTAYKTVKTSATVSDWDAVLGFIQEGSHWNMLDKRVNKTAVEQFRDEHQDLPPGVNWREEVSINIRR